MAGHQLMINVKIARFNPDADAAPYLQNYVVADEIIDLTILDVLDILKRRDSTLQFCRPGQDGLQPSDRININGANRAAHTTRMKSALNGGNTVVLNPLTGRRVIRDLIVEMLPADDIFDSVQHRYEYGHGCRGGLSR